MHSTLSGHLNQPQLFIKVRISFFYIFLQDFIKVQINFGDKRGPSPLQEEKRPKSLNRTMAYRPRKLKTTLVKIKKSTAHQLQASS